MTAPTVPGHVLLHALGQGARGTVWLAHPQAGAPGALVAIKLATGPGDGALARERDVLARLDHPCTVRLRGSGRIADGRDYIVMDHAACPTLSQWLATRPAAKKRLGLLRDLAAALAHIHARGIAHRDLVAHNVLVRADGQPLLIDFGNAAHPASPGALANDMHAMGRLILEVLASGSPADLQAIARRAAAADPSQRYPAMADLLADLDRHRAGLPVASYSRALPYRASKWLARNRDLVVSLLLAGAFLGGTLGFMIGE